jgi:hypothetical protein
VRGGEGEEIESVPVVPNPAALASIASAKLRMVAILPLGTHMYVLYRISLSKTE